MNAQTTLAPIFLTNRFPYRNCTQINDEVLKKRVYVTPEGERLPSVTTILSGTKDMTFLNEWRAAVGEEKAAQIVKEASGVGTHMHAELENYVMGMPPSTKSNLIFAQARSMADVIKLNGLSRMKEVWAIEQSLYYPGLYSGTTDGIGVFENEPHIFDYKQTNRPKTEEHVEDYKMQLVAYALAHNEVYGTDIKRGVIFMCSRSLQYQEFRVTPETFDHYRDLWLDRVYQYYKQND